MPTIDSELSPLSAIRIKVRRLTRSPSTSQLTNDQLDDYINTFVLYDFPEFTVDNQLTFYTYPNIDTYQTNGDRPEGDPFFNFKNVYLSVQPPVYIAGSEVELTQSRSQFFARYPKRQTEETIATGDGARFIWIGTLSSKPVLAGSVSFSSVDLLGHPQVITDTPLYNAEGIQTQAGELRNPEYGYRGAINYLTGVYTVSFPVIPDLGQPVIAQTFSYATGRPRIVLYENNAFTFRPVPDKSYRVDIDAFRRPTELLQNGDEPDIAQWWQYIAYGAAKKVFEDRMDVESVKAIAPEFLRQRSLVMQRLIVQQSSERTPTIYSEKGAGYYGGENTF